jgi:L-lactate dehydrogenase complex protein LldE
LPLLASFPAPSSCRGAFPDPLGQSCPFLFYDPLLMSEAVPSTRATSITRVQLFATCLVDQFCPDVAWATVRLLERLGLTVHVPLDQTCCGQPAFNGGFLADARVMARQTIAVLSADPAPIVVPSGSCAEMIIHHFPPLLADDAEWSARAAAVAARTYELVSFLTDVLGLTDVGAVGTGSLAYHASCHGLRGLGLREQPLRLLSHVRGVTNVPLPQHDTCCGFGGLFAVKMAPVSGAMLDDKLDAIEQSGAETIVAADVSCLMHIGGGLKRRRSRVQVKHIAEVLGSGTSSAPVVE